MKTKIQTASKRSKTPIPFPCTHVTTWDIGNLRPTFIKRLKQGWKFDVNYYQLSRLQPLAQPTFGAFRLKTYAFWVPFHSIWDGYEQFISEDKDPSVSEKIEPFNFSLYMLFYHLFGAENDPFRAGDSWKLSGIWSDRHLEYDFIAPDSLVDGFAPSFGTAPLYNYDFVFLRSTGDISLPHGLDAACFNLSEKGRYLFNVLRGLGYEVPNVVYFNSDAGEQEYEGFNPALELKLNSEQKTYLYKKRYSIYPWLAFARSVYDYIYPSAYVQKQGFGYLFDWNLDRTAWEQGFGFIMSDLLKLLFTAYDKDFFTTLWSQPNSVANTNVPQLSISLGNNPNHPSSIVATGDQTESSTSETSSAASTLSAYTLRWLESVSDYVMRNNIGGNRFHEWLKAHFGLVDNEVKTRSRFLKAFTDDVNFFPITASAGTNSNVLGEQAGQAECKGSGHLSFTAPCDGFLIYLSMLVPYCGYYQGNKPYVDALTSHFQLYMPEFDGVGFEGVPRSHLFSAYNKPEDYLKVRPKSENNAFGFATRYSDSEKRSYDFLTGNFRFNSKNTGLDGYHTFRNVLYGRENLALDSQFLRVDNQYDRVFQQTDSVVSDHVMTMFTFDCKLYADMLSLAEALPLFNKKGESTVVDYEGTQI